MRRSWVLLFVLVLLAPLAPASEAFATHSRNLVPNPALIGTYYTQNLRSEANEAKKLPPNYRTCTSTHVAADHFWVNLNGYASMKASTSGSSINGDPNVIFSNRDGSDTTTTTCSTPTAFFRTSPTEKIPNHVEKGAIPDGSQWALIYIFIGAQVSDQVDRVGTVQVTVILCPDWNPYPCN